MVHGIVSASQPLKLQPAIAAPRGTNENFHYANLPLSVFLAFRVVLQFTSLQPVIAQQSGPLSKKVGEADLTPTVRLDYVSNSNSSLTSDHEVKTTVFII